MVYQVLARKWRPRCFQEVVGQAPIVQALSNALNQKYLHHAYLFTGTRGVGKTTISRILAKSLNCEKGISANPCNDCENCREIDAGRFPDFFEVDAASRTKVEDTRELLDNIPYSPIKGRFKIYLIDEVHMLSGHSFNALLKTLEEPPSHIKFILATTNYHKLPVTVLSRCLQFHLTQLLPPQIAAYCHYLLTEEKVTFETTALDLLARAANGSVRDALNLLDQSIAYGNGKVVMADIKIILGTVEPMLLFNILEALSIKSGSQLLKCIAQLAKQGVDFSSVLADLLSLLHQITIIQTVPDALIENDSEQLRQLATFLSHEDVQLFYQIGLIGQRDLHYSPTLQIGFEMTLLRMLVFYPGTAVAKINFKTNQKEVVFTWPQLLPQLNLIGATLAMAQQCSLKEITKNQLHLILNHKKKSLLQPKHLEQIGQALSKHLKREIKVKIDISNDEKNDTSTSVNIMQKKTRDWQTEAEKRIINDQQVQRIMRTFDAKLITENIVPHDKEV